VVSVNIKVYRTREDQMSEWTVEPRNRRGLLMMAAAAGVTLATPRLLRAAVDKAGSKFGGDLSAVRAAIDKQRPEAIKRLQNWIALPSIAAENRNMKEGCQMMIDLLKEAGFQTATMMPTDGQPGVFATLDAGARRTVGMYFMYDVKQFDPSEWSSPALDAAIVDRPLFGKVMIGRGAINQKGPEATWLAALHALKAAGRKPPVNIVLVAEGEAEIGGGVGCDQGMQTPPPCSASAALARNSLNSSLPTPCALPLTSAAAWVR
jgi:hypothetical protein